MGSRVVIESVNTSRSGKYRMFRTISVCLLVLVQMVKAQEFCESSECSSCLTSCDDCNSCGLCNLCFGSNLGPCSQCKWCDGGADGCKKKCAKNVWLNVSNMITTYTVDVTLNKFIK